MRSQRGSMASTLSLLSGVCLLGFGLIQLLFSVLG